jgi:hypothetical protein
MMMGPRRLAITQFSPTVAPVRRSMASGFDP